MLIEIKHKYDILIIVFLFEIMTHDVKFNIVICSSKKNKNTPNA